MPDSVHITGIGCICASGASAAECMECMLEGERQPSYERGVESSHAITYPVFAIPQNVAPVGYADAADSAKCGILALHAATEALINAGFSPTGLKGQRIGVCIGTTVGNSMNNDPFYREYLDNKLPNVDPILDYLKSNPATYVGRELGVRGPVQTITSACSSGSVAIGEAMGWIRSGLCDIVIAGGADKLCPIICNGFAALLIADPEACRPFDNSRKGLNLGEGAGMLILESAASAACRGVAPRAEVLGYGNACDSYHLSAPDPAGKGLRRAMAEALEEADIAVADIAFITAHGTGTKENDRSEGLAFAEMLPRIPYFSIKGYTGHTLGAAGGIEAALTVTCLEQQRVPASAGFAESDPEYSGNPTTAVTSVVGDYAISDSIAFGGNCAALIFGRARA